MTAVTVGRQTIEVVDGRDPEGRWVCMPGSPWTEEKGRAVHPLAKDDGECWDGCCDKYECGVCGTRFRVEVAQ